MSASDDPYNQAAARLDHWVSTGLYRVDPVPTLYVYEMRTAGGVTTRGLVGALELRDPADGSSSRMRTPWLAPWLTDSR